MTDLVPSTPSVLVRAGQAANAAAASWVFHDYVERQAHATQAAYQIDLRLFVEYLETCNVPIERDFMTDPEAWHGMTWGLVAGFVKWMVDDGFAIASINRKLATVKTFTRLAAQAGVIPAGEYTQIRTVRGYGGQAGRRLDEVRAEIRQSTKKAAPTPITVEQARQLKRGQPNTPQGWRDALVMCLFIDHGFRVSEVVGLQVSDFDLKQGMVTFYRKKVDKTQTHRLSRDTLLAAHSYAWPAIGPAIRGSRKNGELWGWMGVRSVNERVRQLGMVVGAVGLSPHDLRHFWATQTLRNGTDLGRLQDAGGWASPNMPLRYAERAKIANEGVIVE